MRLPPSLLFYSLPLCSFSINATLVDQIAIAVGKQAITASQIETEIKLSALQNGVEPDQSESSRKAAADRLIEQALVKREMAFGSYPAPPDEQVDSAFANTQKARGGKEGLDRELGRYSLTEKELRDYLKWQISLLRFIDLRFRPAVQVSRADVQKYYEENYQARAGVQAPALNELRTQIASKLTGERVDQEVDRWIAEQRKTTTIRFLDSSLGRTTIPAPQKRTDTKIR